MSYQLSCENILANNNTYRDHVITKWRCPTTFCPCGSTMARIVLNDSRSTGTRWYRRNISGSSVSNSRNSIPYIPLPSLLRIQQCSHTCLHPVAAKRRRLLVSKINNSACSSTSMPVDAMFTLFSGRKLRKALWVEMVVTVYAAQLGDHASVRM